MSIETDEALHHVREEWYREAGVNQLPARVKPKLCPVCRGERRWEVLEGGGVNAACDGCGYRGARDDLKPADVMPAGALEGVTL